MVIKLVFGGFLLAHGLVHLLFLAPPPAETAGGPSWPFELGRSWALSPAGVGTDALRVLAIALIALLIGAYALAALTGLGIGPGSLWAPAITVGALASLALLGLFFRPWLSIGVAIDLVLLWLALQSGWVPEGLIS